MKSKRFFVAVVIALCLFLFSCGSQSNDFSTTNEEPTTTWWQFTAKQSPTQSKEEPLWADSCIHEEFIYYAMYDGTITRTSVKDPNEMEIIVIRAQLEALPLPVGGDGYSFLNDINAYGDLIIGKDSGISNVAYNLKTGELYRLLDDFTSMAVWRGMVYYVEHAARSFSLFRKPLNKPNAQPELLLGTGQTRSAEELGEGDDMYANVTPWVRSVYVVDNRHFFTQNNDEVWEFKENGK